MSQEAAFQAGLITKAGELTRKGKAALVFARDPGARKAFEDGLISPTLELTEDGRKALKPKPEKPATFKFQEFTSRGRGKDVEMPVDQAQERLTSLKATLEEVRKWLK
jgi:hypothetical protein